MDVSVFFTMSVPRDTRLNSRAISMNGLKGGLIGGLMSGLFDGWIDAAN
jgi:hypothetical protein